MNLILPYVTDAMLERFWYHVEKGSGDSCWVWTGGKRSGYGSFYLRRDSDNRSIDVPAHRFSWVVSNNLDIPPKMFVCHKCDNPPCVNPTHLFIGTCLDNMQDCSAKGRKKCSPEVRVKLSRFRGDKFIGPKKLTDQQVAEIRLLYSEKKHTQYELARAYGVSETQVSAIIKFRSRVPEGRPLGPTRRLNAKLHQHQVAAIRRMYTTGQYSYSELGFLFDISFIQIGVIVRGEHWKYVKDDITAQTFPVDPNDMREQELKNKGESMNAKCKFGPHGVEIETVTPDGREATYAVSWNYEMVTVRCLRIGGNVSGAPSGQNVGSAANIDAVLGLVVNALAGGLPPIEFSQALLPAATPGCPASDVRADKVDAAGTAPTKPSEQPAGTSVGGVSVVAAPEQKPATTRKRGATKPPEGGAPPAAGTQAPAAQTHAQGTPPVGFATEMKTIDAAQAANEPAAQRSMREPTVEAAPDQLDRLVMLLTEPPMPMELSPLDSKRLPSDKQFLDTCYMRLYFQIPVGPEYAKNPDFVPKVPPKDQILVDMQSDQGVVAFVNLLDAIQTRADSLGKEIPQIAAFFAIAATPAEVARYAVEKIAKRRQAR